MNASGEADGALILLTLEEAALLSTQEARSPCVKLFLVQRMRCGHASVRTMGHESNLTNLTNLQVVSTEAMACQQTWAEGRGRSHCSGRRGQSKGLTSNNRVTSKSGATFQSGAIPRVGWLSPLRQHAEMGRARHENWRNIRCFPGGARRMDRKPRFDLIPFEFLEAVAEVLTHGAVKYGPYNWKRGRKDFFLDAWNHAFVHLQKFKDVGAHAKVNKFEQRPVQWTERAINQEAPAAITPANSWCSDHFPAFRGAPPGMISTACKRRLRR